MYTESMGRAFNSLQSYCPKGFEVELIDNKDFLTVRVSPEKLARLSVQDQYRATDYLFRVKNALEDNGAIVLIVREALQ